MRRFSYIFILLLSVVQLRAGLPDVGPFPVPDGLALQVQFWVNVYSHYSLDQRIIHDRDRPERIYSVVDLRQHYPTGRITRKMAARVVGQETRRIRAMLENLASGTVPDSAMTPEMKRIKALFGKNATQKSFRLAAGKLHAQRGARESFEDGLQRSGRYLEAMQQIFINRGLPAELVYLAHVESSFNPHARSSAGALGIWQFTRLGGRRYFEMGKTVDQRRDPLLSTVAAANKLADLKERLGSWPLAVSAYNIGEYGIERAASRSKSRDLNVIVRKYRHRNFGFSSRNFYTSFLAAVQVASMADRYFPNLEMESPWVFRTERTDTAMTIKAWAARYQLDEEKLAQYNPALSGEIRRNEAAVPKDEALHVPLEMGTPSWRHNLAMAVESAFSSVSVKLREWLKQHPQPIYVEANPEEGPPHYAWPHWSEDMYRLAGDGTRAMVYPEETLAHFARWCRVSESVLRQKNRLSRRGRIEAGQELVLDFSCVTPEEFEIARIAHHRGLWHSFFLDRRIESWRTARLAHGETFWSVAARNPDIPYWLLWAVNADTLPAAVTPGTALKLPVIARLSDAHHI